MSINKSISFVLSQNAECFSHKWIHKPNEARLAALVSEVGELADAIRGEHDHPLEVELIQIGGMMINWLGLSHRDLDEMLKIANHEKE